ncbi:hypothetical protein QBC42DRAFT_268164 [Cladorrhinum samala]|uniref:Uncharacterized protein n=1 Tax=Cladorrhinum samala TaxID=585594 RepID=A0AAV9HTJ4_9PEZI|nr:hypothetical protein QBC42DRAFT_268164 [Cladorrhinum samala]
MHHDCLCMHTITPLILVLHVVTGAIKNKTKADPPNPAMLGRLPTRNFCETTRYIKQLLKSYPILEAKPHPPPQKKLSDCLPFNRVTYSLF